MTESKETIFYLMYNIGTYNNYILVIIRAVSYEGVGGMLLGRKYFEGIQKAV